MASPQPVLPTTAPFAPDQIQALNLVMAATNPEQRHWLSGFLAGYHAATGAAPASAPMAPPRARIPLTILYATESGNAEAIALDVRKAAAKLGFAAKAVDMADTDPIAIGAASNLLVIASTWGEGDPPERAAAFHDALMAEGAPRFEGVRFAVLALGDSSYVDFCEVGRRLDARLEALGGERIADRIECDLDYEAPAAGWTGRTLDQLEAVARPEPVAGLPGAPEPVAGLPGAPEPVAGLPGAPEPVAGLPGADVIHVDFIQPAFGKAHPFLAEVTDRVVLSGSRSTKETLHLELSLAGSGLAYEPGDSLAVVAENDPAMVEAVLRATGLAGEPDLSAQLMRELDITVLSRQVIEAYAEASGQVEVARLLAGDAWRGYLGGRQLVDLLEDFPVELTPAQLTAMLRKLPPRLYSIASSPKAVEDEAHLLLGVVRYQSHGRARHGVASTFVADRVAPGAKLGVYVKPNRHFRLPDDPDRPIVMVGPGTGVAPFRAFLQAREAVGAGGRSWLFFGERHFTHDFLYQLEWQDWLRSGVLSRLDLAFSRDQPEKIYVQDRMWARRAELYGWLEEGAHLYVCGDEKAMAKDVHATLVRIVAQQSGRSAEAAEAQLAELRRAGRYQRDVY